MRILPYLCLAAVLAFGCGYIRGYRVISLEEIPNSHRPSAVFVMGVYDPIDDAVRPVRQLAKKGE